MTLDAATLIAQAGGFQERLYRHRCVEAWAMAVPWTGVPLANVVALARPSASARYLRMETFLQTDIAPGQRQDWYPWPYVEGLTLAEATHDLAFLATGIYGKPMPAQNGAPIRLVTPWKYGQGYGATLRVHIGGMRACVCERVCVLVCRHVHESYIHAINDRFYIHRPCMHACRA